ncbi:RND family efflux transporter MFP subunit (plasmid) [Leptolyngbya sp. NIES-3755]|nr:RND family efflux transporter MFP subunit [Leptolyngbya sp. NIES-3755]
MFMTQQPHAQRARSRFLTRRSRRNLASSLLLSFLLLNPLASVRAGEGHSEEFSGGNADISQVKPIEIDDATLTQLGIKVEPVTRRRLAFGIPATGQIEAAPNRKVAVTTPVTGTIVKLLAQPGDTVKTGQPVAVITSGELANLRVEAFTKRAEAGGDVRKAEAALTKAQQNYEQQLKIAQTDIQQAKDNLKFAQSRYEKDSELLRSGAIPSRTVQESGTKLSEARAALVKAESRLDVINAQNEVKNAQSDVEVAQSRVGLSSATYQARLQQLGTSANPDGTVTVTAPISGTVAEREASLGESASDPGKPIMTIIDSGSVLATANVYEKDLDQIQVGQPVRVEVSSLPKRTFQGRVSVVGSAVQGQTRALPVKAELDNAGNVLKPGMFAKLEIMTDRTYANAIAVPKDAIIDSNGKDYVFVKKDKAFQAVEVKSGRAAGELLEIKEGLSDNDQVVTQGTTLMYAQALRGGKPKEGEAAEEKPANAAVSGLPIAWWLLIPGIAAIAASTYWMGRRSKPVVAYSNYKQDDESPHGDSENKQ